MCLLRRGVSSLEIMCGLPGEYLTTFVCFDYSDDCFLVKKFCWILVTVTGLFVGSLIKSIIGR